MASDAPQAYTVHRRSLAYIELMSFSPLKFEQSGGKDHPHRLKGFGEQKKSMATPLERGLRRFQVGAVHSVELTTSFFLVLLWVL